MFTTTSLKFKTPFCAIVAAPSGGGKTYFVRQFLREYQIQTDLEPSNHQLKVLWCYGQHQRSYINDVRHVIISFRDGLVSESELLDFGPQILVIDDLMSELKNSSELSAIFTKISHHRSISVFFLVQNLFCQGREMRNISLNAHYFILMKNPRDRQQVATLGRQIFPGQVKSFTEIFDDATSHAYGYLIIDMKSNTPDILRLRTRILQSENSGLWQPIVYRI